MLASLNKLAYLMDELTNFAGGKYELMLLVNDVHVCI